MNQFTEGELRTTAKVLRQIIRESEIQIKELPWWERIFTSSPESHLKICIINLESIADKKGRLRYE